MRIPDLRRAFAVGVMPIHFERTIRATKQDVAYTGRTDEYTLAFQFKPVAAKQ